MTEKPSDTRIDKRILVVGTTSDYIDMLRKKAKGRLLFVTAHNNRVNAVEPAPGKDEEILCDPQSHDIVVHQIRRHLRDYPVSLGGIVCYDCESMELAAHVAHAFGLDYPSSSAILNCRDKSGTKALWADHGVPVPQFCAVRSEEDVRRFFSKIEKPCVLKPVDGSGSERVFKCVSADECVAAFQEVRKGREAQKVIMEECVDGTEYSCDFMIDGDTARLIRMTRKIPAKNQAFGTTMAYELVDFLTENISFDYFSGLLFKAARSLGLKRSICMLDFMVNHEGIKLLEIAPRPGGDCLPWLIERATGLDILALALSFAENKDFVFKRPRISAPYVGLRIHAKKEGRLESIDTTLLSHDARVTDIYLKHRPGHMINRPPLDYDSFNLGHILFKPAGLVSVQDQSQELLSQVKIHIGHERKRSNPQPFSARSKPSQPAAETFA